MLASTSAVQQMIGAPLLTAASPVSIPTFSAPNVVAQREELLRDERLDRRGVERHPPLGHRREVRRDGDQRLPRARRRGEDHVVAAEQLDHRLVLVRVEGQPLLLGPADERLVERVGLRRIGEQAGETHAAARRSQTSLEHRLKYGDGIRYDGRAHT